MPADAQTTPQEASDPVNTSQPSAILPEVAGLAQLSDIGESLSIMVFSRLKDFRNNFDALRSEEKRIESAGDKVFNHLDTILEQKLTTMERDTEMSQKRRQSMSKEKKTDNTNKKRKRKYVSCPKEERTDEKDEKLDIKEDEKMDLEKIPEQATQVPKSGYLVSKQKSKPLEVFLCLLCYLEDKQECMWVSSEQYLFHIYEKHQIQPDFEALLRSQVKRIPFSHFFYKGTLTNIFQNSAFKKYLNIFYHIKKGSYDKLFHCGCRLTFSRTKKLNSLSCFNLDSEYIGHIKRIGHKDQSSMSHVIKKVGSIILLERNPSFNIEQQQSKIQQIFLFLKQKLNKYANWITVRNLLVMVPMNMLQIISCNPGLIPPELVSGYLTCCYFCSEMLSNQGQYHKHLKVKHNISKLGEKQKRFIYTRDQLFQLAQQRNKGNIIKQFGSLSSLTPDQQRILDSQIFMIKHQCIKVKHSYQQYYRAMVCGHCKTFFANSTLEAQDYLLHIYLEHDSYHPLNTHYIKFAQNLPNDSLDSDEEQDE